MKAIYVVIILALIGGLLFFATPAQAQKGPTNPTTTPTPTPMCREENGCYKLWPQPTLPPWCNAETGRCKWPKPKNTSPKNMLCAFSSKYTLDCPPPYEFPLKEQLPERQGNGWSVDSKSIEMYIH